MQALCQTLCRQGALHDWFVFVPDIGHSAMGMNGGATGAPGRFPCRFWRVSGNLCVGLCPIGAHAPGQNVAGSRCGQPGISGKIDHGAGSLILVCHG